MVHDRRGLTRVRAEVQTHLEELGHIVSEANSYAAGADEGDLLRLRAFGSLLHDFYTGVEAIFQIVADEVDGSRPTSSDWHRRLLSGMAAELPEVRPPVISRNLESLLDEYRGFRHIFRNVYGRRLTWHRMKPLVEALPHTFEQLKTELSTFFAAIEKICE